MSSIINKIIEIDSIAQQRLNDAYVIQNGIRQQILEKNEQTNRVIHEKAESRIAKIDELEQQYANEELVRLREECDAQIERLEQFYSKNHVALEKNLFDRVIGR